MIDEDGCLRVTFRLRFAPWLLPLHHQEVDVLKCFNNQFTILPRFAPDGGDAGEKCVRRSEGLRH